MASRKKKDHLIEIDLARAATAPASQKKSIIRRAIDGGGYDRFAGVRSNLGGILGVSLPLATASRLTRGRLKAEIARACKHGPGEIAGNQSIALGLFDFVEKHKVTAVEFDFEPVSLGRAGRLRFWYPYLLKIEERRYIPFFDFRQETTRLTAAARRFTFSIDHNHIRGADLPELRGVGFVVFQFGKLNEEKVREAIAHFDDGISFWSAKEIGEMVDETFRILDEILKAA